MWFIGNSNGFQSEPGTSVGNDFTNHFKDNFLMPLDAFALGMNLLAKQKIFSLQGLLSNVQTAIAPGNNSFTPQEKQLLVSMVLEIDRQGLNAVKLNQNETIFQKITGQRPTPVTDKKTEASDEEKADFSAILSRVRNNETQEGDVTNCRLKIQSSVLESISNFNDLEDFTAKVGASEQSRQVSSSFNAISNYVVDTILVSKDHSEAKKMCRFFINVMVECIQNNDFHSAMEISSALQNASIDRLMKEDGNYLKEFESFESNCQILKPDANYKELRTRFESLQKDGRSYIPYLGMINTDLTFNTEGQQGDVPAEKIVLREKLISHLQNAKKYVKEQPAFNTSMTSFFAQSPFGEIDGIESIERYRDRKSLALKPRKS